MHVMCLAGVFRMRPCPAKHRLENQLSLALACGLWELEPARGNDWDMEAIHLFAKLVKGVALQFLLISYETVDCITKCQVSGQYNLILRL